MRYEFERDGVVVASVSWEGPAQVSVEAADSSTRAVVDRYLSSEVVYLGSGFDFGAELEQDVLQTRRRDWTPWEFERACRNLGHRLQAHGPPGRDRPGRSPGGGRPMKMSGADALLKALEQEGVEVDLRDPRRRQHADLRPAGRPLVDPAHPLPSRAGRGPRRRGLRVGDRQGRCLHGDIRPRGDEPRHAPRRREDGLGPDRRDHRDRCRPRWSATTPSRRPTSPASRCRSRSTTSW